MVMETYSKENNMIPQQLNIFSFDCYYTDCLMDGLDAWDALWYCVNYLPPREG